MSVVDEMDGMRAEIRELKAENARLRALVQTMLDEDPNDLCADGGVTVLMVWRKEARRALEGERHGYATRKIAATRGVVCLSHGEAVELEVEYLRLIEQLAADAADHNRCMEVVEQEIERLRAALEKIAELEVEEFGIDCNREQREIALEAIEPDKTVPR